MYPSVPTSTNINVPVTSFSQKEENPQVSTVSEEPSSGKKSISEDTDFQVRIKIADFYCPIRHTVMKHPVLLSCGHSFGEKAIEEWFKKNKTRLCPLCKQESPTCTKNLFLKNAIEEWKKTTQVAKEEEEVEILKEQKSPQKRFSQEDLKERVRDIQIIATQGSGGKALAIEMLLTLQQEYPNEQSISRFLQFLLNSTRQTQSSARQGQSTSNSSSAGPTSLSIPSSLRSNVPSNRSMPNNSPLPHPQHNANSSFAHQPINVPPHQSHHAPMIRLHPSSGSQQPMRLPMIFNPQFGPPPARGPYLSSMMPLGFHSSLGSQHPLPMGFNSQFGPSPLRGPQFRPPFMGGTQFEPPPHSGVMIPLGGFENTSSLSDDNSSNSTSISLKRNRQDEGNHLPTNKRVAIELALSEKMKDIFHLAREGNLAQFKAALNLTNVKLVDDQGNSVLHEVVLHQRSVDFIALIMKKGLSVNVQNKEGNTALHIATRMGIIRIMKKLFEYGADKSILNAAHKTAEQMNNAKSIKRFFAKQQLTDQEGKSDIPSLEGEE
jgi:hypothetical protein